MKNGLQHAVKFMRVSSDKNSFLPCSNLQVARQRQNMKPAQTLGPNVGGKFKRQLNSKLTDMKYKHISLIIIWITATLTIMYACGQSSVKKDPNVNDSTITENKLTIDTFSTFPLEIDGCSCYFSNDSNEFKKQVYIYVNDFAQTSFLKINGVMTKFTQIDFKNIDDKTTEAKAVSGDYKLTIKVIHGEQSGNETSLQSGTIILTDNKGNKIAKTFYGECGC